VHVCVCVCARARVCVCVCVCARARHVSRIFLLFIHFLLLLMAIYYCVVRPRMRPEDSIAAWTDCVHGVDKIHRPSPRALCIDAVRVCVTGAEEGGHTALVRLHLKWFPAQAGIKLDHA